MNVKIGAEAALFPEKEYKSGIFVAVQGMGEVLSPKNITIGAFSTADILRISCILSGGFVQINYEYFL
jgi:hypothetical protein